MNPRYAIEHELINGLWSGTIAEFITPTPILQDQNVSFLISTIQLNGVWVR
jgi:hypothetical protein